YVLVERSPVLRARQERLLRRDVALRAAAAAEPEPAWRSLEDLEQEARDAAGSGGAAGCLFANEVLDAFPAHRVAGTTGGLRETHVALDAGADRLWETAGPLSPGLAGYLENNAIAPEPGQILDVAPDAARFTARLAGILTSGWGLFVDYGEAA